MCNWSLLSNQLSKLEIHGSIIVVLCINVEQKGNCPSQSEAEKYARYQVLWYAYGCI